MAEDGVSLSLSGVVSGQREDVLPVRTAEGSVLRSCRTLGWWQVIWSGFLEYVRRSVVEIWWRTRGLSAVMSGGGHELLTDWQAVGG